MRGFLLLIPATEKLNASTKLYPQHSGLQESLTSRKAYRAKLRSRFLTGPEPAGLKFEIV